MKLNEGQAKLAVLIDADNTGAAVAQGLFEEIAKYGIASVKRIYGDWSSPHLSGWRNILLRHALTPVQQFAYTKGKDATDMGLIIDAMDLLYSGNFHGFCLVSSDSDFTPLAARIRQSGLTVYGFGRKNTPEAFRQACDRFFYVENLGEEAKLGDSKDGEAAKPDNGKDEKPDEAKVPQSRQMDEAAQRLLYKAIKDTTNEATGWAPVSHIGQYINQTQPDFDSRSYGYGKLSGMLRDLRGLQFRTEGTQMFCRKIPYRDVLKLLSECLAKPSFLNAQSTASIDAVEKWMKPRWSWSDYGFADFKSFLETVDGMEIQGERMRLLPKTQAR
ncbi:nuclease [Lysobacteraceae bacterium NML03-0222]|nr:nuclease [Xanthomonadaceae bacterium NML03-0222]